MHVDNVNLNNEVMLIAEIGNNHEGDINLAEKMIKEAASSGAHAVKFQTIEPDQLVSKLDKTRYEQLCRYSLTRSNYEYLAKVADNENIIFLSTPFSINAVDWLDPLVPAYKIASGDNNFNPLIKYISEKNKPIILSTGMSTLQDIEKASLLIKNVWKDLLVNPGLALLHCVSAYPANMEDANLSTINLLQKYCDVVGYSDHVMGIDVAVLSVAAGARIVEKHFTLDKKYSSFRDHSLSANPAELKTLADKIVETLKILGTNKKHYFDCEKEIANNARRSIVVSHKMLAGEKINISDLKWLRPADGISPDKTNDFIGKTLKKDIEEGQKLNFSFLI
jgi:N,N'-diacetyllegionaminate synthase